MSASVTTEHRHDDMHPATTQRRCPTRVLLAGPRGDLETLVLRMPHTWSLQQPLETLQREALEKAERANATGAVAVTRTANAVLAGGKVPDKSATSVMICYTPVRMTLPLAAAASDEEPAEEGIVDVAAAEEKAAMNAELRNSGVSTVESPFREGPPSVHLHVAQTPHEE